jgi:hypothetical protein
MTSEPASHVKSAVVGNLKLPPPGGQQDSAGARDPLEKVSMLIELNTRYPGGLAAVNEAFNALWSRYLGQAGGGWPAEASYGSPVLPTVPPQLAVVAPNLYQCVVSRVNVQDIVEEDRQAARSQNRPPVIFHVWPDYTLYRQIDRSGPTVKADAAWRSYDARAGASCGRSSIAGSTAAMSILRPRPVQRAPRPASAGWADQPAAPRLQLSSQSGQSSHLAPPMPPPTRRSHRAGNRPCPTRTATAPTSRASFPAAPRTAGPCASRSPRS